MFISFAVYDLNEYTLIKNGIFLPHFNKYYITIQMVFKTKFRTCSKVKIKGSH